MGAYIDTTGWSIPEDATTASGILWIEDSIYFVRPERTKIIPDHGDLIDRNALLDSSPVFVTASFGKSTEFISRYKVIAAPVVIPAERIEDEHTD